jgi:hypothetical protein
MRRLSAINARCRSAEHHQGGQAPHHAEQGRPERRLVPLVHVLLASRPCCAEAYFPSWVHPSWEGPQPFGARHGGYVPTWCASRRRDLVVGVPRRRTGVGRVGYRQAGARNCPAVQVPPPALPDPSGANGGRYPGPLSEVVRKDRP